MTRAVRMGLLTAIWLVLWSHLTVANVLSGLLVAGIITSLFPSRRDGAVVIRPIRAARFVVVFAYQLIESALVVARTVIAPRNRVRTGIIAVPLTGCSDAVATVVADAITLTPGTLTLEVRHDPLTLYVHALDTRDLEQVQRDIRDLEVLVIRAFGDEDAISGLDTDDTTSWTADSRRPE